MNKTREAQGYFERNPHAPTSDAIRLLGVSGRTARRARLTVKRSEHVPLDKQMPRVLLFDLETAPMEVYVWGLYKQRISPDNVIKDWSLLSWAAKWLFEPEIISARVGVREARNRSDESIVIRLWDLIDEADIIIAHNAARFDNRKMNARFILNGFPPPMPYQTIDTLKTAQRNFAFSSHKLDYLNQILDLPRKIHTSFELWKRCVTGDESALEEMEEYNRGDITALEELYVKLRPWIKSHPNMGLYVDTDGEVCPNCTSDRIDWIGFYYTPAGRYRSFRCIECGAVGRSRYSDLEKDERLRLSVSVAR